MATALPLRLNTSSGNTTASARRPSFSSFPSSKRSASQSTQNDFTGHHRRQSFVSQPSPTSSYNSASSARLRARNNAPPPRSSPHDTQGHTIKSQYPPNSSEKHVEYILVASFDIDRGSIMEHQYPGPVGGDEVMLAELMLPDQTHLRSQDWTIFFLHKDDADAEQDENPEGGRRRRRHTVAQDGETHPGAEADSSGDEAFDESDLDEDDEDSNDEPVNLDGPPLVYVLNLVNTKQDNTVKRGAIVKAMAICTRHSFLHIYKPLLLLALEQYFAKPTLDTLASLYDAVNSMDLSLMPRLSPYEKFILQASSAKDLFIEKFEAIIAQRMADSSSIDSNALPGPNTSPTHTTRTRYGLPRDTHEFESVVRYANVPVPVKIPVAVSAETVGDFSLIKLITIFATPHSSSPVNFNPTHPHLTTSGPTTHPIIVLLNALLTQKRIIFLGHNLPSSEVAEAVLGACALASGGMLRGFTRYAFPYTDLTKIDDLLNVPGFIAGVTNPAFAHKTEWWDLLCDISTGRMKISNRIEPASITDGVSFFQQNSLGHSQIAGGGATGGLAATLAAGLGGGSSANFAGDPTGDTAFMNHVLSAIHDRHGENAIRTKFRLWVSKFTRLAAAFEEAIYGASALDIHDPTSTSPKSPFGSSLDVAQGSPAFRSPLPTPNGAKKEAELPLEVLGHGYVWPTPAQKNAELAANATRIEGWRTTRSYYNFVQDLAAFYTRRPVKAFDLQHLHDKLAKLRPASDAGGNIYLAICAAVHSDAEISQLLATIANGTWDARSGPQGMGPGLFYLAFGLFHTKVEVREAVADLLARVQAHEAGRHFWGALGRYVKMAWERVMRARDAREGGENGMA